MTKSDLINEVAARAELTKTAAKANVEAVLKSIVTALKMEEKIQIAGFGTFSVVNKPKRQGINPKTKEKITIPAKTSVKFKPVKSILD